MAFVKIILPIFIIISMGVFFEKIKHPDFKTISDLTLYFFAPCLVFAGLLKAHEQIASFFTKALAFMVALTLIFWGLSILFGHILKFDPKRQSAFSLSTIMMNTGNYGLPLVLFAYGPEGLAYGVIVMVLFTFPLGTLAIYIASRGRDNPGKSFLEMFKIPLFYAVVLAALWRWLHLPMPGFIFKTIDMVGEAAIPGLLILLGMQLARTRLKGDTKPILSSSFLRLIISPIVAFFLCFLLNIKGLPRNVLILQTSTPSAIIPLLYAVKYDTHPEMVAGNILASTLLSAATLTGLLYFLGA